MSPPYRNRYPQLLEQELEAARRAGVDPVDVPSSAFTAMAATGVRMIFVVLVNGGLVAAPRRHHNENISHAAIAGGGPVIAAGEFSVEIHGPTIVVSELNDMSGHYQPGADGLVVARRAFGTAGIAVRLDAVTSYDWEAP